MAGAPRTHVRPRLSAPPPLELMAGAPRPRLSEPPRPPPELNSDACSEILLRVSPDQPELLFRCAVVCKRWRFLLSDPAFLRHYREFHAVAPMLGYAFNNFGVHGAGFVPIIKSSITVPEEGARLCIKDSRHGRVLFHRRPRRYSSFDETTWNRGEWDDDHVILIWDPVSDERQYLRLPAAFPHDTFNWTAAIICDAPGCDHLSCHGRPFRVIFIGSTEDAEHGITSGFVYTSATGAWTATASAQRTRATASRDFVLNRPTALVGNSLYLKTDGRTILRYEFGEEAERMQFIDKPPFVEEKDRGIVLMPAAGGRLRFAGMLDASTIQLWETEVASDGSTDWVETGLLRIPVPDVRRLIGCSPTCLFVCTKVQVISILLSAMGGQMEYLPKPRSTRIMVPVMGFYTTDHVNKGRCSRGQVSGPSFLTDAASNSVVSSASPEEKPDGSNSDLPLTD